MAYILLTRINSFKWSKNNREQEHWVIFTNILAATEENVPVGICAPNELKSAWASTQSDQSLRCPHEETWVSLRIQNVDPFQKGYKNNLTAFSSLKLH